MPLFDFKQFLPGVPLAPGVYLMKNGAGEVLYVGKARELRKRLASYARTDAGGVSKTAALLSHVRSIETMVTGSEKEALILESSLIKQYRPKYNVILRDDKSYPLLKLTIQEEWPRLIMTRRRAKDGARYFGPFSSPAAMWETLRYLNALFPLRRCKERLLRPKARPCLNHQLGRCLAPCAGLAGRDGYQAMVRQVLLVLEGKNRQVVQELGEKMNLAAAELRYEEAALLRDRIAALEQTLEKQRMVAGHGKDQDVLGLVRQGASLALAFLFVRKGVVSGQETFFLAEPIGSDVEIMAEAITRFYAEDGQFIPQEILLPIKIYEAQLLEDWLGEQKGKKVEITIPLRGDRVRLLDMAKANALQVFAERQAKAQSGQALAAALQKALHLARPPVRIECLDISNLSGLQAVGSLVCFVAGEKASRLYRHYSIRTVPGPDDYAMMAEVLTRRFRRGLAEGDFPDLLLVDGGKGQLGVAMKVCAELGVPETVELAGIAKERAGEGEKLYRPGRKNPINLPAHSPSLLYLMRIRDEAHRYGITMHRRRRGKEALTSALTEIPGLGKARVATLLRELGSARRVAEAGLEELAAIKGIGPELAGKILAHLQDERREAKG